jgi:hypothetical protein
MTPVYFGVKKKLSRAAGPFEMLQVTAGPDSSSGKSAARLRLATTKPHSWRAQLGCAIIITRHTQPMRPSVNLVRHLEESVLGS